METKQHFYTATEIAALARCTRQAVYRHIRQGKLPARIVGGTRYLIAAKDVSRFVDLPIDQLPAPEAA